LPMDSATYSSPVHSPIVPATATAAAAASATAAAASTSSAPPPVEPPPLPPLTDDAARLDAAKGKRKLQSGGRASDGGRTSMTMARRAAKEVEARAKREAAEARRKAGLLNSPDGAAAASAEGGGEGDEGGEGGTSCWTVEANDELAELLKLTDGAFECAESSDSAAARKLRVKIDNAAQLRRLLLADPGWHARVSAPLPGSVASVHEILEQLSGGVAFLVRGAGARSWGLGDIEARLRSNNGHYSIDQLCVLLEGLRSSTTEATSLYDNKFRKVGLRAWLDEPKEKRPKSDTETGQLRKLLHVEAHGAYMSQAYRGLASVLTGAGTQAVREANWVGEQRGLCFQLAHSYSSTGMHTDNNGTDTFMKPLAGKALIACWSLADGLEHGLHDDTQGTKVDWDKFRRMGSARLFMTNPGDLLFLPSGTFHYVYTIRTKLVVAGDFFNAVGWKRRVASVERDHRLGVEPEIGELHVIFARGLERVERPRVEREAAAGEPISPAREEELLDVLAWAMQLEAEGGDVTATVRQPAVRAALGVVWRRLHPAGGECPYD
jgi:hypothetical protein